MTNAVQAPEVEAIDLDFAPASYFPPYAPDPAPPLDGERGKDGRIYRMVMPGLSVPECLPPLRKNEREIARIALRSVQADQISVRARRKGDRIAYSIVDEYEDQVESQYKLHPATSRSALTMRQLVAMLDGARDRGGAVMCYVVYSVEVEKERAEDQYGYVSVRSDFCPELRAYYEARTDRYIDEHASAMEEDE